MSKAEQMFTALLRLNKDAKFIRYRGEGHVFSSPANIRDSWQQISEWFADYLAPDQ
ncbi:alpha/beta hydrolase family protein [Woeseia oceani]|uniref:alpha/beta hydrolase family protein n=1 Tax=Woeseia oceani TaxID=1548547 RepID=UPI0012EA54BE|nr:prolyl oligopeptidase family serine peptidase [Woeseia oceani]